VTESCRAYGWRWRVDLAKPHLVKLTGRRGRVPCIEDSAQIAGINGGLAVFNWVMAIGGALLVERLGRRPLWLISTAGMLVTWVIFTGLSGAFNSSQSASIGAATVAFIFLYNGFYDIAWTPLSYSYTSEVLPTSLRASGMAIFSLGQALCCIADDNPRQNTVVRPTWTYGYLCSSSSCSQV
jgi:MFS family permease